MKRSSRIFVVSVVLVALSAAALAVVLSYGAPCPPAPQDAAGSGRAQAMQAIVYRCYGPPTVLRLETIARPVPADDEVRVRVHAAALNPLDWHYLRGEPYVMRLGSGIGAPASPRVGMDFAGTVEAVGSVVTRFKAGDEVFGASDGALSEYTTVRAAGALALKADNLTFGEAAAVPIAALTALQALRDLGGIEAGHKVLINGASGGVGTFAVQIAKAYGAQVTGVCSTRNVELVRALGADVVVDYTRDDFTAGAERYDLIVDNVSNQPLSRLRSVLKDDGTLVIVGASPGRWIGPLARPLQALLLSPFVSQKLRVIFADLNAQDLQLLAKMLQEGSLRPVIDRSFTLEQAPAAMTYLETGRARGKIIITLQ